MNRRKMVLFRAELGQENEEDALAFYGPSWVKQRSMIPAESIVMGRYSVLPYYQELETDLAYNDSVLVNSWAEHQFIANASNCADLLGPDITPPVYSVDNHYLLPEGPYVVKGQTNSMKQKWLTHMFAQNKEQLVRVLSRVRDNAFLENQGLICRPYVKLRALDVGVNGLPVTNEWRTFWINGRLVDGGFYWANFPEVREKAEWTDEAYDFAHQVAEKIKYHCNFFVLDIAQREDGSWMLVEINDGQMSGLATIDPEFFYKQLNVLSWGKNG